MGITAEATETVSVALLAECRRCLSLGVDMKAKYIKDAIAQLESMSANDLRARVDKTPLNDVDGRDTNEVVVIT